MRAAIGALIVLIAPAARADEGFFSPEDFPAHLIEQRYGVTPDRQMLLRAVSATVAVSQGAGAFVSPRGLVLVKHGVVKYCLHQAREARKTTGRFASWCRHRALRRALPLLDRSYCQPLERAGEFDYIEQGHLARQEAQELRCPNLAISVPVEPPRDVTAEVTKVLDPLGPEQRPAAERKLRREHERSCASRTGQTCRLISQHGGARWELHAVRQIRDVRLVFAPEGRAADFGDLQHHIAFPDHDFKVAFVRAYADGRPIESPHHLRLSARRLREGELTFMLGYPAFSYRNAPAASLRVSAHNYAIYSLPLHGETRGALSQIAARRPSVAPRIDIDDINFSNVWAEGNTRSLTASLIGRRAEEERTLARTLIARGHPEGAALEAALAAAEAAAARLIEDGDPLHSFIAGNAGGSALLRYGAATLRIAANENNPEGAKGVLLEPQATDDEIEIARLEVVLRRLQGMLPADSASLAKLLAGLGARARAEQLVAGSRLGDPARRRAIAHGGAAVAKQAGDDAIVKLLADLRADMSTRARASGEAWEKLTHAERLIELGRYRLGGNQAYSDANGSVRISFGSLRGYQDAGRTIAPVTTFGDLFACARDSGAYRLPSRWTAARAALDASTPLNIATNHDGMFHAAPLVDAEGRLVALMYNGNRQYAGFAYAYEDQRRRMVSVHGAAVIEVLRHVYRATELLRELGVAELE